MAINQSEQLAPVREMRISVEHGEVEVDARAAGKAQITASAQRLAPGARQCEAGVSAGRSRSARNWPECGGLDGYIEQRARARRGSAAALRREDISCLTAGDPAIVAAHDYRPQARSDTAARALFVASLPHGLRDAHLHTRAAGRGVRPYQKEHP